MDRFLIFGSVPVAQLGKRTEISNLFRNEFAVADERGGGEGVDPVLVPQQREEVRV